MNDDHLIIGKPKATEKPDESSKQLQLQLIRLNVRMNDLEKAFVEMTSFINNMCGHLIEKGIMGNPSQNNDTLN